MAQILIPVEEIDKVINKMNPSKESLKDGLDRVMYLHFLFGWFAGYYIAKNNIKTSAPGESDWIRLMLGFRDQQKTITERFNVWLFRHGLKTLKFPE